MSTVGIIDAHLHIGQPGVFFSPENSPEHLLETMDRLGVSHAVFTDHVSITEGCGATLPALREISERSGGRLHYLAVFSPHRASECLAAMERATSWPGFAGVKIHPSFHRVPAEDPRYEPAWRFAAEHGLPILTHSWSASDYNPVQQLSTPARFEPLVGRFPSVRFVLGHAGGRGAGRHEAARMANQYASVYLDFAGDIFCYRLIETLAATVPVEKILFGSDYPWLDPRANLTRVLLAEVDATVKLRILRDNAARVYRIGEQPC